VALRLIYQVFAKPRVPQLMFGLDTDFWA